MHPLIINQNEFVDKTSSLLAVVWLTGLGCAQNNAEC